MPDDTTQIAKIQKDVVDLQNELEDLNYSFTKKTGSGSNNIQGTQLQSVNYVSGSTGWGLSPDGNLEANNGNFRGDITGASGTFSGTLTGGALNIPDTTTADSFHVDSTGNAWWGATTLGSAKASVTKAGVGTFTQVITLGNVAGARITFDGSNTLTTTDANLVNSFTAQESVTAGDAVIIGDGVQYLKQDSTGTHPNTTAISTTTWVSQNWTTSAGAVTITEIDFNITATGSSTITVSIRANSGGAPTGADLGSGTFNAVITDTGCTVVFSSPIAVSPSTIYHAVVRASNTNIAIGRNNSAGQGTNTSVDSGVNWAGSNGALAMAVYEVNSVIGQISKSSAVVNNTRSNNFIGVAFETKSAGQTTRIILGPLATGFSGLTTGRTYYLSDTFGSLSTSAGTLSRKVGISLSTTTLLIKHDNL